MVDGLAARASLSMLGAIELTAVFARDIRMRRSLLQDWLIVVVPQAMQNVAISHCKIYF